MFQRIFDRDFPLWEFLNQRIFDAKVKFLSPREFQHYHRVERLEQCWGLTCPDRNKYPFA
ncbi:hypothetical protein [Altericista sp. CCNU0014]|uniref:hypothetical protein n=1 Tax=Altericista sp. CCNU0014 TaxID=3082949 RepID=UPI00384EE0B4